MTIHLMDLPYPSDALAPTISKETISFHYGKHHKSYVGKTNELAKAAGLESASLEELIRTASDTGDTKLFNQTAQVWNHGFYWMSLTPRFTRPDGDLAKQIDETFGGLDEINAKLAEAAVGEFGSGWAWLLADSGGKLRIETTHDAGCPVTGTAIPLITIDVWEHAYYLDRQNDRKAYVEAVLDKTINWAFAAKNLASGKFWTYPA